MCCAHRPVAACALLEKMKMSGDFGETRFSGAQARVDWGAVTYGLKPVPFKLKRSPFGLKLGPARSFSVLCFALLIGCWPVLCFAGKPKPCVTPREALEMIHKDVCVSAHVYDVVQLSDGTRFLDVCPPTTPDIGCRFTIVSFNEDRDTVGKLAQYRDRNVEIRGVVRPMHGRAGIILSHARQFHGGPPRFRPNPMLLRGFNAEQDDPPVRDPNLRTYGHSRSFMNSRDQETRPLN